MKRTLNRVGSEDGASLVEFALVLPILALILFAMLDFGKAFNYWIDETHLANTGARWAVVNKNPGAADGLSLQQYVKSLGDTSELRSGMTVCVEFPAGTSEVGDPVRLVVTYPYNWMPFLELPIGTSNIRSTATMRLEAEPAAYAAGCA